MIDVWLVTLACCSDVAGWRKPACNNLSTQVWHVALPTSLLPRSHQLIY